MSMREHWKLGALALSCLAIGGGASAIANAGAATSSGATTTANHGIAPRRLIARAVQGDLVIATKTGFTTVTFERGFVQSVKGQQLTMTEGITSMTYNTVTLTIPTAARVRDNGAKSTLADLTPGQHVIVIVGPKQTFVHARTA